VHGRGPAAALSTPSARPALIPLVCTRCSDPEDKEGVNYTQFAEIGKTAAKWGVKAIQVTGWHIGGQDQAYPDHSIDPRLGTFGQSTLKQLANDEYSSQLTDWLSLRGICSGDQVHASTRTS